MLDFHCYTIWVCWVTHLQKHTDTLWRHSNKMSSFFVMWFSEYLWLSTSSLKLNHTSETFYNELMLAELLHARYVRRTVQSVSRSQLHLSLSVLLDTFTADEPIFGWRHQYILILQFPVRDPLSSQCCRLCLCSTCRCLTWIKPGLLDDSTFHLLNIASHQNCPGPAAPQTKKIHCSVQSILGIISLGFRYINYESWRCLAASTFLLLKEFCLLQDGMRFGGLKDSYSLGYQAWIVIQRSSHACILVNLLYWNAVFVGAMEEFCAKMEMHVKPAFWTVINQVI